MRALSLALALPAFAVACAHEVDEPSPLGREIADEALAVFAEPRDVDTERVYLGRNDAFVSEDAPWHYGLIDLQAGARIGIELMTTDGYADWVGFKVYKVAGDGALALLGVVEGEGYAGAVLRSTSGGSFVIESVSEWLPSTLALELSCLKNNGRCAAFAQPGDFCGSRGAGTCDTGLFCRIEQNCGRADEGGVCERPVEICPAVMGPPVCGCDGRTYDGVCKALAAGVNVDYHGACPCDPMVFSRVMDGVVDVAGEWINEVRHDGYGYEVTSRLALGVDGSYRYEQVHTPLCIADRDVEGTVLCRMPSLFFVSAGTWENQGFAVQLHPDESGSPDELAQSFGIAMNCEGTVRLDTVEMNWERTLERDRCADMVCAEGEHCELQEVWCIRAPCPPLPTCVAD